MADLLASNTKNGADAYWMGQESGHWEYSNLKSEMRMLRDMALIDIISIQHIQQERVLSELKKLIKRFHAFWKLFHQNSDEDAVEYTNEYIAAIRLAELFFLQGYTPERDDIFIGVDFVESLSDSVKLREKMLNKLIFEVEQILYPPQLLQHDYADDQNLKDLVEIQGLPNFTDGTAKSFMDIIYPYFSDEQIPYLKSLIIENKKSKNSLIFRGNGNQLADAFKQLFEANLIVGCKKNELERWISTHFLYLYKNITKEYTEGYLNGIISSDGKPCKSPILEVKKKDDKYVIVPSLRNKKNIGF